MDVYQRAWASLLGRIEAKTSWGRNELKQEMLEALVLGQDQSPELADTAVNCQLCSRPLGMERGQQVHAACADREQADADRSYADADAFSSQRKQSGLPHA